MYHVPGIIRYHIIGVQNLFLAKVTVTDGTPQLKDCPVTESFGREVHVSDFELTLLGL